MWGPQRIGTSPWTETRYYTTVPPLTARQEDLALCGEDWILGLTHCPCALLS